MDTETYFDTEGIERCDDCDELVETCGCTCPDCGDSPTECAC